LGGAAVVMGAAAARVGAGRVSRRGDRRVGGLAAVGGWVRGGRLHRLRVSPTVGSWHWARAVRDARYRVATAGQPGDRGMVGTRQAATGAAPGPGVRGPRLPAVIAPRWALPHARVQGRQAASGRRRGVPGVRL